jgi:hypothetical protein
VDDTGKIVRELKVASEPEALLAVLTSAAYLFKRIGLEAGHVQRNLACPLCANSGHHAECVWLDYLLASKAVNCFASRDCSIGIGVTPQ